jgi:hypothetical protein
MTKYQTFSDGTVNVAVDFRARDVHTFGFPKYVLQGA